MEALTDKVEAQVTHRAVDTSPRLARDLRAAIRGPLNQLLREVLSVLEISVIEDRRFELARKQAMDRFGQTERTLMALVTTRVVEEEKRNGTPSTDDS